MACQPCGRPISLPGGIRILSAGQDSLVLCRPSLPACLLFQLLVRNLRGEMTLPVTDEHQSLLQDGVLGRRIAWLLSLNGSQVLAAVWGSGGI